MESPTLEKIDEVRKSGYRPGVVLCFINNRKILMFHRKDITTWMFPQGGIDNKELPEQAIVREAIEEVGSDLINNSSEEYKLFFTDVLTFSKNSKGKRELFTDSGEEIKMKGKKYFFYIINVNKSDFNLEGEFDDFFWLDYKGAKSLSNRSVTKSKTKIINKALDTLHGSNIIN